MFEEEYRNQIDKIEPDETVRNEIRTRISEHGTKKPMNLRIVMRGAFAAAACFALVCSAFAVTGRSGQFSKRNQLRKTVNSKDYSEIFDTIKTIENKQIYISEDIATGVNYGFSSVPGNASITTKAKTSLPKDNTSASHSETTKQVEGVDEADIIKTDGKCIYILSQKDKKVKIVRANNGNPEQCAILELSTDGYPEEMYLSGNRIVIISGNAENNSVIAEIYDISNPESPIKQEKCMQSGYYNDSRVIGNKLYIISGLFIDKENIDEGKPKTYVPEVVCKDYDSVVPANSVLMSKECLSATYTVISGYNIDDSTLCGTQSLLGDAATVYCSENNIITAARTEDGNTSVNRFEISEGTVTHKAIGSVSGTLLNQFSIDEHNGNFRFVTTGFTKEGETEIGAVKIIGDTINALYVLDGDLKQIGAIENVAPGERVYSVRFMGDIGYFVTFRQVDPLFSVDLSNPEKPAIIGSLKIPGFSNYLFPYGEGRLLGIGKNGAYAKLSMFDVSNPANVSESDVTEFDVDYAEALQNHKANLVDYNKNIIGFAYGVDDMVKYGIFSYENGDFVQKAEIDLEYKTEPEYLYKNGEYSRVYTSIVGMAQDIRGLYIGDVFYVVSEKEIVSCNMDDFNIISEVELK